MKKYTGQKYIFDKNKKYFNETGIINLETAKNQYSQQKFIGVIEDGKVSFHVKVSFGDEDFAFNEDEYLLAKENYIQNATQILGKISENENNKNLKNIREALLVLKDDKYNKDAVEKFRDNYFAVQNDKVLEENGLGDHLTGFFLDLKDFNDAQEIFDYYDANIDMLHKQINNAGVNDNANHANQGENNNVNEVHEDNQEINLEQQQDNIEIQQPVEEHQNNNAEIQEQQNNNAENQEENIQEQPINLENNNEAQVNEEEVNNQGENINQNNNEGQGEIVNEEHQEAPIFYIGRNGLMNAQQFDGLQNRKYYGVLQNRVFSIYQKNRAGEDRVVNSDVFGNEPPKVDETIKGLKMLLDHEDYYKGDGLLKRYSELLDKYNKDPNNFKNYDDLGKVYHLISDEIDKGKYPKIPEGFIGKIKEDQLKVTRQRMAETFKRYYQKAVQQGNIDQEYLVDQNVQGNELGNNEANNVEQRAFYVGYNGLISDREFNKLYEEGETVGSYLNGTLRLYNKYSSREDGVMVENVFNYNPANVNDTFGKIQEGRNALQHNGHYKRACDLLGEFKRNPDGFNKFSELQEAIDNFSQEDIPEQQKQYLEALKTANYELSVNRINLDFKKVYNDIAENNFQKLQGYQPNELENNLEANQAPQDENQENLNLEEFAYRVQNNFEGLDRIQGDHQDEDLIAFADPKKDIFKKGNVYFDANGYLTEKQAKQAYALGKTVGILGKDKKATLNTIGKSGKPRSINMDRKPDYQEMLDILDSGTRLFNKSSAEYKNMRESLQNMIDGKDEDYYLFQLKKNMKIYLENYEYKNNPSKLAKDRLENVKKVQKRLRRLTRIKNICDKFDKGFDLAETIQEYPEDAEIYERPNPFDEPLPNYELNEHHPEDNQPINPREFIKNRKSTYQDFLMGAKESMLEHPERRDEILACLDRAKKEYPESQKGPVTDEWDRKIREGKADELTNEDECALKADKEASLIDDLKYAAQPLGKIANVYKAVKYLGILLGPLGVAGVVAQFASDQLFNVGIKFAGSIIGKIFGKIKDSVGKDGEPAMQDYIDYLKECGNGNFDKADELKEEAMTRYYNHKNPNNRVNDDPLDKIANDGKRRLDMSDDLSPVELRLNFKKPNQPMNPNAQAQYVHQNENPNGFVNNKENVPINRRNIILQELPQEDNQEEIIQAQPQFEQQMNNRNVGVQMNIENLNNVNNIHIEHNNDGNENLAPEANNEMNNDEPQIDPMNRDL